jgi:hypothetical protein
MYTDAKIFRSTLHTDVDGTDVGVEKRFVVNASLFHSGNHSFCAKVTERRIVNLDIA